MKIETSPTTNNTYVRSDLKSKPKITNLGGILRGAPPPPPPQEAHSFEIYVLSPPVQRQLQFGEHLCPAGFSDQGFLVSLLSQVGCPQQRILRLAWVHQIL